MKKKTFCMVILSVLLGIGATSCSKDKDSEEDYALAIAGTYKGVLHIANMPDVENVTIEITRDGVNRVTLKMNETVLTIPISIACESILLSNAQDISGVTTYNMPTEAGAVPVPVTIKGTIKSGTAALTIQVSIPDMPVEVVFDGKKQ
jgi:hypothetical protein